MHAQVNYLVIVEKVLTHGALSYEAARLGLRIELDFRI